MFRHGLYFLVALLSIFNLIGKDHLAQLQERADLLNEPVSLTRNSLVIAVDPRIELISIVQYLSDYRKIGDHLITQLNHSYRREADQWFSAFKGHAVIALFNRMSASGFSYEVPSAAMLHLDWNLNLDKAVHADSRFELWRRTGGIGQVVAFSKALKVFSIESDFPEFFREHKSFYEDIAGEAERAVHNADIVEQLEQYYGEKRNRYTVILAPLLGDGAFGPQVERTDGLKDIYSILGPSRLNNGLPVFGSSRIFVRIQRHEFSHSFVNPLTDRHRDELAKYLHLFRPLKAKMSAQAYCHWQTVINESIVRAISTRLAFQFDGTAAGIRELEYNRALGFIFTDSFAEKLVEYERNRDRYPTLASFYIQLLSVLDGFSESMIAKLLALNSP